MSYKLSSSTKAQIMATTQANSLENPSNSVNRRTTRHRSKKLEPKVQQNSQKHFLLLLLPTCLVWFLIATVFGIGNIITIFIIGIMVVVLPLYFLGRNKINNALSVIAYLAPLEPAIRLYAPEFRYNILQYLVPLWVFLILWRSRGRVELTTPVFAYGSYLAIELAGLLLAESLTLARAVFVPSLATFFFILMTPHLKLKAIDIEHIWHSFLLGACSLATLTGRIVFSGQTITWTTQSNFQASGGMGPNQVSFMLCVAVFVCLLMSSRVLLRWRWLYFMLAGLQAYLMILTFSRGGLYILTGVVLVYFLLAQRLSARSILAIIFTTILLWSVFSFSTRTTEGVVLKRYNDLETSNRVTLIELGWQVFLENPLFGVGTGSYFTTVGQDDLLGTVSGAHNEWTRAAAEHGIFGVLFWSLFVVSVFVQAMRGFQGENRALRLALTALAFASMFYNGLKLIIQPYLILLALTAFSAETTTPFLRRRHLAGVPMRRSIKQLSY